MRVSRLHTKLSFYLFVLYWAMLPMSNIGLEAESLYVIKKKSRYHIDNDDNCLLGLVPIGLVVVPSSFKD